MSKVIITLALCGVLVACSKAPPAVEAPPAVVAPKPAYPGAGTVMQDQFKALENAKKVEQQVRDAESKRRAEFDQ